jgi:hypothetical protein
MATRFPGTWISQRTRDDAGIDRLFRRQRPPLLTFCVHPRIECLRSSGRAPSNASLLPRSSILHGNRAYWLRTWRSPLVHMRIIQQSQTGVNYSNGLVRRPAIEKGEERKIESLLRLGHNNFPHNCRAGRNSRLDHNQSQKCLHCVGADVHPIRNLLAAQAFQQVL